MIKNNQNKTIGNKFKIGITGVGGGVGQSIIKSLYSTDYELVGMDGEVLAAGLYATPRSYVIPYAMKDDFIPSVLSICAREKIDLLFPGMDAELPKLSAHAKEFKKIGTTVIVSSPSIIQLADDKLLTAQFLSRLELPAPKTMVLDDYFANQSGIEYPIIIKPKIGGFRSRNVFNVKNNDELLHVKHMTYGHYNNYVAQEYIEGDEYTCGSITLEGQCRGVIVMRRILRDGDTHKCFTENNSSIEHLVKAIANEVKPFGAMNVQLRVRDSKPYVFEINARCSGTTAARSIAGFNEPAIISDYLLKNIEPVFSLRVVNILRYWKEIEVPTEAIASLEGDKYWHQTNHARL